MAESNLTLEFVNSLLEYRHETGVFVWRADRRGHAKAGDVAGYVRRDGYVKITVGQKRVFAHRLAWFVVTGEWPRHQIDHVNGNTSDNRMSNLRDVDSATNMENEREGRRRKCGGSLIGAHWSKTWGKWKSSICSKGKSIHIGWFDTEQQAHEAYVQAKRSLHQGCTI